MPPSPSQPDEAARRRDAYLREVAARRQGYRERALAILPHVCASCGREFEGRRLRELTVHHKDHNHDHNPPDGSNWELLCLYCHEHEHSRAITARYKAGAEVSAGSGRPESRPAGLGNPFANLDALLGESDEKTCGEP